MAQLKKTKHEQKGKQILYLGRYVEYHGFRVFVYAKDGTQKLCKGYEEYQSLVSSGQWFSTKEDAEALTAETTQEEVSTHQEAQNTNALKEINAIKNLHAVKPTKAEKPPKKEV
jgi:hypothetical protein